MCKIAALVMLFCLTMVGIIYAAPVDIPTVCQYPEGKVKTFGEESPFGLAIGGEMDYLNERELDESDAEAEAMFFTGKLIFTSEKADFYFSLGQATEMEYKYKLLGSDVEFELSDETVWGVGATILLYEWEDAGIDKLFFDSKYRRMDNIDYESVTVDGVKYSKSQLAGTSIDAQWEEWQFALGFGKKFEKFMPYFGIKYSDTKVSGSAVIGPSTYDLGDNKSEDNVGVFLGCSITPMDAFSIDLQGRFVDEMAFSIRGTYNF